MAASVTDPVADDSRPVIALLSLKKEPFWDEQYSKLLEKMEGKAIIKDLTNVQEVARFLSSQIPAAIIATDGAIVKKKPVLSRKLVQYVNSGGTLVLATHFPSFVRPMDLDSWFQETWSLPWKSGEYHRTTVSPNPRRLQSRLSDACLPGAFSVKALALKNVAPDARVYVKTSDSRVQSCVFPPTPVDTEQSPVVFAKIGNGWLGYIGDVNGESESDTVLMAMCGL